MATDAFKLLTNPYIGKVSTPSQFCLTSFETPKPSLPTTIAIFPVKEKNLTENDYKGHEYMSIYPLILYYDGSERYFSSEKPVEVGFYWGYKNEVGRYIITPLAEWLSKKK